MIRKSYRSDLTDKQWQLIEHHLPPEKERGRPRTTNLREVVNALLYQLRTGYQWDMMPEGFPSSKVNGKRLLQCMET
ncbi:transposase [Legionella sainthelensi]|uniref:transposase n=1 Tax=Legionella sainthelensi TaxID=28087 RepID=UPI000E209C1A|nr:transposase [Legionella sainthelensi]